MSITSILILAAIVSAFMIFGAVLAWGDYQTSNLTPSVPRRIGQSDKSSAAATVETQIAAGNRNSERTSISAPESVHQTRQPPTGSIFMDPTVTVQLPHALKRIRLEESPNGSATHGYEFVAPLDADAHINRALWYKYRGHCRVHRFWGDDENVGGPVHKPGRSEHARWVFDYDSASAHDGEAGYHFGSHSFRLGEYVSVRDKGGDMHTFHVVSADSAT